jgi:hypothetical protein
MATKCDKISDDQPFQCAAEFRRLGNVFRLWRHCRMTKAEKDQNDAFSHPRRFFNVNKLFTYVGNVELCVRFQSLHEQDTNN